MWQIAPAMIVLAAALNWLHFALFQEDLLSLHYYLVALVIVSVAAVLGFKAMRATQMSTQYSWAFERTGLNWRPRAN
jgi:hypothetical protein